MSPSPQSAEEEEEQRQLAIEETRRTLDNVLQKIVTFDLDDFLFKEVSFQKHLLHNASPAILGLDRKENADQPGHPGLPSHSLCTLLLLTLCLLLCSQPAAHSLCIALRDDPPADSITSGIQHCRLQQLSKRHPPGGRCWNLQCNGICWRVTAAATFCALLCSPPSVYLQPTVSLCIALQPILWDPSLSTSSSTQSSQNTRGLPCS